MQLSLLFFSMFADIAPAATEISPPAYEPTLLKMILTLAGLIVLIVLTVWVLRRMISSPFRQKQSQQSIHILDRKSLSPKSTLYVIEVSGRKIAFIESQAEIKKLTEWNLSPSAEDR